MPETPLYNLSKKFIRQWSWRERISFARFTPKHWWLVFYVLFIDKN